MVLKSLKTTLPFICSRSVTRTTTRMWDSSGTIKFISTLNSRLAALLLNVKQGTLRIGIWGTTVIEQLKKRKKNRNLGSAALLSLLRMHQRFCKLRARERPLTQLHFLHLLHVTEPLALVWVWVGKYLTDVLYLLVEKYI